MKKYYRQLAIFLLVNVSWVLTLFFWFNNVDLSYMKTYFDLKDPLGNFNLPSVMRGHVLLQIVSYSIFGFKPYGYYLIANILHATTTVLVFAFLNKLLKNMRLSFILALVFGINVVYANTLFEGSFNQYYPLLLALIILSILPFSEYIKSGFPEKPDRRALFVPAIFMAIGFLFRETVLIIPLLISLVIGITSRNARDAFRKYQYLVLPLIVSLVYIFVRTKFLGELKSDLTDDAIQVRNAYISGGRWLEWLGLATLNFIRMCSEQVIFFARWFSSGVVTTIVSGTIGLALVIFAFLQTQKSRNKVVSNVAKFGLGWFVVVNLFISFVLPFPIHVITSVNRIGATISRYNYWGFFGLVVIAGTFLLSKQVKNKKIIYIITFYLIVNFLFIQQGALALYKNKHKPARKFFETMFQRYSFFPQKAVIYYNFFSVNNLRDYIGDLTYVFGEVYYPGTTFTLETSLSHVQKEYLNKNIQLSQVYAFDLDQDGMLVDKTDAARQILSLLKTTSLEPRAQIVMPDNTLANTSYYLDFQMKAYPRDRKLCNNESRELKDYVAKRLDFRRSAKVSVTSNYGDYPRFYFIKPENLIDNQLGQSSTWQANIGDTEQSIILDLGSTKRINGLAWYSHGDYAYPTSYTIYISNDSRSWQEVLTVKNWYKLPRIDRFKEVDTRFVKMRVHSTSAGQPVLLTEIETLSYSDFVFDNFSRLDSLLTDAGNFTCISRGGLEFNWQPRTIRWETDKETQGSWNTEVYFDGTWRRYKIPITNLEIYSRSSKILDEELQTITILPGNTNLDYQIKDVMLIPAKD